MRKHQILWIFAGFMIAIAGAATTQAAPPGTDECPPPYDRVHVHGPQDDDSREADRNGDGWVCDNDGHFIDNNIPD
jgi:hypothetical protein